MKIRVPATDSCQAVQISTAAVTYGRRTHALHNERGHKPQTIPCRRWVRRLHDTCNLAPLSGQYRTRFLTAEMSRFENRSGASRAKIRRWMYRVEMYHIQRVGTLDIVSGEKQKRAAAPPPFRAAAATLWCRQRTYEQWRVVVQLGTAIAPFFISFSRARFLKK